MSEIVILVGPPGSGKSTLSKTFSSKFVRISQDELGKKQHLVEFNAQLLVKNHNIVIDRMNFSKEQRARYLNPAKEAGYKTRIIILHENFDTCIERMMLRGDHPTINDDKTARKVLNFFFSKYERPTQDEADEIEFRYPEGEKPLAIVCDLDGTLCNIEHRLHFVRGEGRKDWRGFFKALTYDTVNQWCLDILRKFDNPIDIFGTHIILCSGRTDSYKELTQDWLLHKFIPYDMLFMRNFQDFRPDNIVKEVILDFEILTRYKPYFFIDDRKQVVDMWRRRGYTCLACAEGNF